MPSVTVSLSRYTVFARVVPSLISIGDAALASFSSKSSSPSTSQTESQQSRSGSGDVASK